MDNYTDELGDNAVPNYNLLTALGNKNLKEIYIGFIKSDRISLISPTGIEIMLKKSVNLKSFYLAEILGKINVRTRMGFPISLKGCTTKLKKLGLSYYEDNVDLIHTIKQFTNLKQLLLYPCRFDYAAVLNNDTKFLKLKSLGTSYIIYNDKMLDEVHSNFPNIKELSISLEVEATDFSKFKKLHSLEIKSNFTSITNDMIKKITKSLPTLYTLKILDGYKIGNEGFEYIAENCQNLKTLKICNYYGINKKAADALKKCTKLTRLYLVKPTIADEDIDAHNETLVYLKNNLPNLKHTNF